MSLLPANEPKEFHRLDDLVATRFERFWQLNLSAHPLYTDKKYLAILSKIYDIDIVGLSEEEARELLNLFYELRKYAGTVYVLKKVLSIFFDDVVLDDQVGGFEFDLEMTLQNDVSIEKIEKIKSLVNRYKNVRSHLRHIILNYPNQQAVFKIKTMSVFGIDVYADTEVSHEMNLEKHLNYGLNYRVCFDTTTHIEDTTTTINQKGGLLWRL